MESNMAALLGEEQNVVPHPRQSILTALYRDTALLALTSPYSDRLIGGPLLQSHGLGIY